MTFVMTAYGHACHAAMDSEYHQEQTSTGRLPVVLNICWWKPCSMLACGMVSSALKQHRTA